LQVELFILRMPENPPFIIINSTMRFKTSLRYRSRGDKPAYVWDKYQEILRGNVLDVGGDRCGLKTLLPEGTGYTGIGIGEGVDIEMNLEHGAVPFSDGEFDCVLCLDVLEHLDNIHEVFDDLCRVSNRYLVISLPNPWKDFMRMLRHGHYRENTQPMKFYNLPVDAPPDRHKWFFSPAEAERFLAERGSRNGFKVIQVDYGRGGKETSAFKKWLYSLYVHRDIDPDNLFRGTQWTVLEKVNQSG
jgi:hypothetical protein